MMYLALQHPYMRGSCFILLRSGKLQLDVLNSFQYAHRSNFLI